MLNSNAISKLTLGLGVTAIIGGVAMQGVAYQKDPSCQYNSLGILTCGVANGEMPIQLQSFNSPISGTSGSTQHFIIPSTQNGNLLISILDNLHKPPNPIIFSC